MSMTDNTCIYHFVNFPFHLRGQLAAAPTSASQALLESTSRDTWSEYLWFRQKLQVELFCTWAVASLVLVGLHKLLGCTSLDTAKD
jgi:hypothetical protein